MKTFPLNWILKMNIDFIEASGIFTGKDTPDFSNCQISYQSFDTGRKVYNLQGCKKVQLAYNPLNGVFVLRGSISYFIQGHNFSFDKKSFVEAIDYIGSLLKVNLWHMELNILETGVILAVEEKPKDFITHHREGKGMVLFENPKAKGYFRSFNDSFAERKMYDAGKNIHHKQGLKQREIIQKAGWNPEGQYLKWEIHYLKPELLNKGRAIKLYNLMNPLWADVFKADIKKQYSLINPMKSIIPPKVKSNLHAIDIFALELVENKLNEGRTIPEVKRLLYDRINASDLLSKADKDARKRQIKAILDKLEESSESKWDLSQKIDEAISEEISSSEPDS